jgi:hypothetical protein
MRAALAIVGACTAVGIVALVWSGRDDGEGTDGPDPRVRLERQRDAAHPEDARAKARSRSLVRAVEACYRKTATYTACEGSAKPGQARLVAVTDESFTIVAVSRERTGGRHHTYRLSRDATGREQRTCTAGPDDDSGACISGGWGFAHRTHRASTGAASTARRNARQDADAKSRARRLADAMHRCFRRTRDYVPCQAPSERTLGKRDVGAAPGQAQVVTVTPEDFTIASYSLSGEVFTLSANDSRGQTP